MTTAACLSDEAIAAWMSTELSEAERERAIEHAAGCARCRRAIAHLFAGPTPTATRIGRYEVEGPLGAGGMGVVFRGRDVVLDRAVAIKMIRATLVEPAHRERLLRESQAMAKISHPNVVTVHEFGEAGGEVFVAMELVTGTMLQRWLATPHPQADRLAVVLGAGHGIAAVHAAGLVHRDIKPENLIVRDDGTPVLVDFGLAHVVGARALGSGSARAGTPHYLAPEIVAGSAATAASDQYQWWTIVEETLTGLSPTQARALARVIARGHALEPARRFASMTAAIEALELALAPPRRGRPRRTLLLGVLVLAAAAGGAVLWWPRGRAQVVACDPVRPAGWSSEGRAAIERGLRGAGVASAPVLAALDQRVATTSALRVQACRESAQGGNLRNQWTRRLVCLDESWALARRELAALASTDAAAVREAVDMLAEIVPADRCGRGSLPAIPEPLPPERRQRYTQLTATVQAIEADTRLTPTQRSAKLHDLEPEIAALGYAPLAARWRWALGHALSDANDRAGAAGQLALSAQAGLAAGDDNMYVRALISQIQVTPGTATAEQVATLESQAIAGALRLGNPQIDAQLLLARASLQLERGDYARARALYEEADRLYTKLSLSPHAMHVAILQNLGAICLELGELHAAEAYLVRAVAAARIRYSETGAPYWEARAARAAVLIAGKRFDEAEREMRAAAEGLTATAPDSAQLGMVRAYLCSILLARGRVEDARAECAASVAATQQAIGTDSPGLAFPLTLSGQVELHAEAPAAALPFLRRAMTFVDAGSVRPIEAATARAYLAIALRGVKQVATARALAKEVAPALRGPELDEARGDFLRAFPELTRVASPPE